MSASADPLEAVARCPIGNLPPCAEGASAIWKVEKQNVWINNMAKITQNTTTESLLTK